MLKRIRKQQQYDKTKQKIMMLCRRWCKDNSIKKEHLTSYTLLKKYNNNNKTKHLNKLNIIIS